MSQIDLPRRHHLDAITSERWTASDQNRWTPQVRYARTASLESADAAYHVGEIWMLQKIDQPVGVDIAEQEIAIFRLLQAKKLGRERRNIAGHIHAGHGEWLDQLVCRHGIAWPQHLLDRMIDFTDEGELAGVRRGEAPELAA